MSDANELTFPVGFTGGGVHCGIKNSNLDLGVVVSDRPAVFAASTTTNRCRAHSIARTDRLRSGDGAARAIVACSGNANCLNGPDGAAADEAMAGFVADQLGISTDEVITASTGSIGQPLPIAKIEAGVPEVLAHLDSSPARFAEAIMTTDRVSKIAHRELFIDGKRVQLCAMTKGAGMIQPAMATMLCFVTTDADIARDALQSGLQKAVRSSFNQITVDNDMSTNDVVAVLANGAAENPRIELGGAHQAAFEAALAELLEEAAVSIARDGEGATRLLSVQVQGAASVQQARQLALGVTAGSLVKSAVFGADPYAWGRILGALGAKAAAVGADVDVATLSMRIQDVLVFEAGEPRQGADATQVLKARMREDEIAVHIDLGRDGHSGRAWGCDLTYDYVKINADYGAATATVATGGESLGSLAPASKKALLIEALRYIYQFRGRRAVIKLGGAAMVDPNLEREFAEDVLLLESVGLRPIVVHGGGPEISRTLDRMGHDTQFVGGLRVTDEPSMAVVEMVLSGKVNQSIVAMLNRAGHQGVGLSGKDGGLIRARKYRTDADLGRVGEVESIDTSLLDMLLEDGRIPVVSPVGLGEDGIAYNINADVVAAELAAAVSADKLIFLSDVPGLLEGDSLVSELDDDQLKMRIERGDVTGGMLPKVQAALKAIRAGVGVVHLVDGRVPHNLIAELFTDKGVGTLIRHA